MQIGYRSVPQYTLPDCSLTLAEALEEYYNCNPTFRANPEFLGQPPEVVVAHDICHVVFGCGSNSADELVVETWTLFGTYIPVKKYVAMTQQGIVTNIVTTFGPWRMVRRFCLTAPRILKTLIACVRLKKRWDHFGYKAYLQVPLKQIRHEFNIHIV